MNAQTDRQTRVVQALDAALQPQEDFDGGDDLHSRRREYTGKVRRLDAKSKRLDNLLRLVRGGSRDDPSHQSEATLTKLTEFKRSRSALVSVLRGGAHDTSNATDINDRLDSAWRLLLASYADLLLAKFDDHIVHGHIGKAKLRDKELTVTHFTKRSRRNLAGRVAEQLEEGQSDFFSTMESSDPAASDQSDLPGGARYSEDKDIIVTYAERPDRALPALRQSPRMGELVRQFDPALLELALYCEGEVIVDTEVDLRRTYEDDGLTDVSLMPKNVRVLLFLNCALELERIDEMNPVLRWLRNSFTAILTGSPQGDAARPSARGGMNWTALLNLALLVFIAFWVWRGREESRAPADPNSQPAAAAAASVPTAPATAPPNQEVMWAAIQTMLRSNQVSQTDTTHLQQHFNGWFAVWRAYCFGTAGATHRDIHSLVDFQVKIEELGLGSQMQAIRAQHGLNQPQDQLSMDVLLEGISIASEEVDPAVIVQVVERVESVLPSIQRSIAIADPAGRGRAVGSAATADIVDLTEPVIRTVGTEKRHRTEALALQKRQEAERAQEAARLAAKRAQKQAKSEAFLAEIRRDAKSARLQLEQSRLRRIDTGLVRNAVSTSSVGHDSYAAPHLSSHSTGQPDHSFAATRRKPNVSSSRVSLTSFRDHKLEASLAALSPAEFARFQRSVAYQGWKERQQERERIARRYDPDRQMAHVFAEQEALRRRVEARQRALVTPVYTPPRRWSHTCDDASFASTSSASRWKTPSYDDSALSDDIFGGSDCGGYDEFMVEVTLDDCSDPFGW